MARLAGLFHKAGKWENRGKTASTLDTEAGQIKRTHTKTENTDDQYFRGPLAALGELNEN